MLLRLGRLLAIAAFVVSVPLLLVLTNVRTAALSESTYLNGYARYGTARVTGMSDEQLRTSATQIVAYFRDGTPITLQIRKETGVAPLFNQRESAHLVDVRNLFQLVFRIQEAAAVYIAAFALVLLVWQRGRALRPLARYLLGGSLLTVGLFAAFGLLATVAFDSLFLQFHLLSFSNDLWQLDPRTDYMIRMFPQGFWFDITMQVTMWSLGEAIALAAIAGGYLWWQRRRQAAEKGVKEELSDPGYSSLRPD